MAIAPAPTITEVISEFLGSAPTLQEIVAFRLPEAVEHRALELLELHRNGQLTAAEREEMEELTLMGHFMNKVKLQARLKLAEFGE
jgi:hypothetical protein